MIEKLMTFWTDFGVKVMSGYVIFVEKVGPASIIMVPIMLLGFTIPWFLVMTVLLAIDILYGRIVLDISIKEQVGLLKEGIMEGYNGMRKG